MDQWSFEKVLLCLEGKTWFHGRLKRFYCVYGEDMVPWSFERALLCLEEKS